MNNPDRLISPAEEAADEAWADAENNQAFFKKLADDLAKKCAFEFLNEVFTKIPGAQWCEFHTKCAKEDGSTPSQFLAVCLSESLRDCVTIPTPEEDAEDSQPYRVE